MMVMGDVEYVYLNTNDHYRASAGVETREARFVKDCMQQYPLHKYERLAPILHRLRSVKSPQEIALLQQACDITEKGFQAVAAFREAGHNRV